MNTAWKLKRLLCFLFSHDKIVIKATRDNTVIEYEFFCHRCFCFYYDSAEVTMQRAKP